MRFRECDVFFLGTARRKGGKRSSNDGRVGIDHLKDGRLNTEGTNAAYDRNGAKMDILEAEINEPAWCNATAAMVVSNLGPEQANSSARAQCIS